MHVYVAFVNETLCDHLVAAVQPPPRRDDRTDSYGRAIASAADVYMDTKVRGLGLWVEDTGFKYFGIRPRRLPSGVAEMNRAWIERAGIMIGPPGWISRAHRTVLTTDVARMDAKRLLALVPTLTPYEGELDGDGALHLDYMPPRPPRQPRRRAQPSCPSCGR